VKHSWRPYAAAAALLYLAGTPFALDQEWKDVRKERPLNIAGRFLQLSAGRTRFDLLGRVPSEVVVFVHGFTAPSYVWGELPKRLRKQGYRTLVYDLFGRGFSDRPDVPYDRDLFDRQLLELLGHLQMHKPVHLVGLSMGGIVATEFALRHPGRVASLTLIDPAGFSVDLPGPSALLAVPLLGEYLMHAFGDTFLLSANAKAVYDRSLVPSLQAKFQPQLAYTGYKRAILSTARLMPLADFTDGYRKLARRPLKVELFWGRQDQITPVAGAAIAMKLLPKAQMTLIDGAGHLSHYEKPDVVTPKLIAFLRGAPAPQQQGKVFTPQSCAAGQNSPDEHGEPVQ